MRLELAGAEFNKSVVQQSIAHANNVHADNVTVTVLSRHLSVSGEGRGSTGARRLSAMDGTIIANSASKASALMTSTADVSTLTDSFSAVTGIAVTLPFTDLVPMAKVSVATKVIVKDGDQSLVSSNLQSGLQDKLQSLPNVSLVEDMNADDFTIVVPTFPPTPTPTAEPTAVAPTVELAATFEPTMAPPTVEPTPTAAPPPGTTTHSLSSSGATMDDEEESSAMRVISSMGVARPLIGTLILLSTLT
jgi:hypothetical protein